MTQPSVSVVIPTYDHEIYILSTLESVFAQQFIDYEVIVVNDGSPDRTAQVVWPLSQNGRIKYLEQPNAGQAAARNIGLAKARGEFIAFLDDDDIWPPDRLEWQVAYLRQHTSEVCVCGIHESLGGENKRDVSSESPNRYIGSIEILARGLVKSPGQATIRTGSLRQIGGFDESLWGVDDRDMFCRLARYGPIFRSSRVSLFYRHHANNASRNWRRMFDNHQRMLTTHLSHLDENRASDRKYVWSEFIKFYRPMLVGIVMQAVRGRRSIREGASALVRLLRMLLASGRSIAAVSDSRP